MKESIVEIPLGSGNRYRYEYSEGKTHYRGPVGDAPPLSEEAFRDLLLQPEQLPTDHDEFKKQFPGLLELTKEWTETKQSTSLWIIEPESISDSDELYVWKNGQPVTRDQLVRAERALQEILTTDPYKMDEAYIENQKAFSEYRSLYRIEQDDSFAFKNNPMAVVWNHDLRKKLEKVHPDFVLMSDLMKHLQLRNDQLFSWRPR